MDTPPRLVKWTWSSRISPLVDGRRRGRGLLGASLVALLALVTPALSSPRSWPELLGGRGRVLRTYESALRGALVELPDELAATLAAQPEVEGVFQDVTLPEPFSAPLPDCSVGVARSEPAPVPANPQHLSCGDPNPQQPAATCVDNWGLDRLDGTSVARDGVYAPPRSGAGVHLFVVDTGLYAQHQDFTGRVGAGTDATGGGGTTADCGAWSHGTHVAGIAAGTRFGVAKGAVVHPVRVSSCTEGLQISSLVTAFDWIAQVHRTSILGPAVATMSINVASALVEFNEPTQPLGVAIAGALAAGVLVIESAGNQAEDACGHVVRVPGMLLVGGSDELDTPWERAPGDPNYAGWCEGSNDCGSNTGSCVDLFAPAAHIVSAWLGAAPDPHNACRLSGTSMAAPHAAGAAALYLEAHPTATPAQVRQALLAQARPGLLALPAGSPDRLLSVLEGASSASISPTRLDFADTHLGMTSPASRLTVTSGGTLPLHLGSATVASGEFLLSNDTCSQAQLDPGASCGLDLAFAPTDAGVRSATLTLSTDAPSQRTVTVALSGRGVESVVMSVALAGSGAGLVRSLPTGLSCGTTCAASFSVGSTVTLIAEPSSGSTFAGWADADTCLTDTCPLVASKSRQVTAFFATEADAGADGPDEEERADGGSADGGSLDGGSAEGGGLDGGGDDGSGSHVVGGCGCGVPGSPGWLAWLAASAASAAGVARARRRLSRRLSAVGD